MTPPRAAQTWKSAAACGAALLLALTLAVPTHASGNSGSGSGFKKGRETGFPVPRYVSLKANQARMRIGPSTDHATKWIYTNRGMPIEITEEYGNWRRVRDFDGVTGWMSGSLLSGTRTAMVGPWLKEPIPLNRSASSTARVTAQLSPKVIMRIKRCDGSWCEVSLPGNSVEGYVDQGSLWGVYPDERIQ